MGVEKEGYQQRKSPSPPRTGEEKEKGMAGWCGMSWIVDDGGRMGACMWQL